ncbi:MAG TPA: RHS repeat-associated core domain-containing protein [Gemmatimonadaceae bacterium]|nr:RHS repeat-associated core domain-containing protein [Gemmatimonadaceae bacterium]
MRTLLGWMVFAVASTVGVRTVLPPVVDVTSVNSGAIVERDECLTVALGSDAAAECGDLRVVHALPSMRTLSRDHTPILLYNSQHARPMPIVAANVSLPSDTVGLSSIVATLKINGLVRSRGTWKKTFWPSTRPARIALTYDASSDSTGIYRYSLDVTAYYGATATTQTVSGDLVVVNRKSGYFGSGWWLAGFDKLLLDAQGQPGVWIGGDGSVRRYKSAGVNVWTAAVVDRPDTLRKDGNGFARVEPHGVLLRFDSLGRHIATRDRLGYETTFSYDASGRLDHITLPLASVSFQFRYALSGQLRSIDAPYVAGTVRTTTIYQNATRVDSIGDPDGTRVRFAYPNSLSARIVARTDRIGAKTAFSYDSAGRVSSSMLHLSATDSILTTLTSQESIGLANASGGGEVDTTFAYTTLDGPRTDVSDVTKIYVNRFGAPRKIIDALNNTTTLDRNDPTYPALVTRLTRPNAFATTATYDARGNPSVVTDINPLGDGRNATTRYEWQQSFDYVTKIVRAEGDSVLFGYDAVNGNRLWQQPGPDPVRRVSFSYGTNGLLASVTKPLSGPDSVFYDALGNFTRERSPLGFISYSYNDAIGRDTVSKTPVDSLQQNVRVHRSVYDVADRVTLSIDSAPRLMGDSVMLVLRLATTYDAEGRPLTVSRSVTPDLAALGELKDSLAYDSAGRQRKKIDIYANRAETWVYDQASNVLSDTLRNGGYTAMTYDALNRLSTRMVPSVGSRYTPSANDTASFAYDPLGSVVSANNRYARITRSYAPSGLLVTDTTRILTAAAGSDFSQHVYGLGFAYDLDGRRVRLRHPANIALSGDTTRYEYDGVTGLLSAVVDGSANRYEYRYDAALRPVAELMPGGIVDTTIYDQDDRKRFRLELRRGSTTDTLHRDSINVDATGRILTVATYPQDEGGSFEYTGLGAVRRSFFSVETNLFNDVDAFGNRVNRQRITSENNGRFTLSYEPHSTRLTMVGGSFGSGSRNQGRDTLTVVYDLAGNQTGTTYNSWVDTTPAMAVPPMWGVSSFASTSSTYSADGHLMTSLRSTSEDVDRTDKYHLKLYGYMTLISDPSLGRGVYEEYRYDALGRRIWVWSHRNPYCKAGDSSRNTECYGAIQRTVWDGDQILYEIRQLADSNTAAIDLERDKAATYPGPAAHFGIASYIHGPQLDEPVALVRHLADTVGGIERLALHRNWRGEVDLTTWTAGTNATVTIGATADCQPSQNTTCVKGKWPGGESNVDYARARSDSGPPSWYGSVTQSLSDGTGQLYKRNRYYDPVTGRFTQEDPIGLAGGLNSYGFAEADPVNFSDPFGLCPVTATDPVPCSTTYGAAFGALGTAAGVFVAGGCSAGSGGICLAGAPWIIGGGTTLGTLVGVGIGHALDVLFREGDPEGASGGERAGKPFTPAGKEEVRGPEGTPCAYCKRPTTRKPGPTQSQGEHVIPQADLGNGSTDNGVNACRTCNLDKRRRSPKQWEPRWYDPKK